jgi:hypothetical protein
MHAIRRSAVVSTIVLAAAGASTTPAIAGQVVKEPGFVSANASFTGTALALISHYVGTVGPIVSDFSTSGGPGTVSALMTGWAHEHGDQVFCVGPE